MTGLLRYLFLLALVVWIGGIVFFSFIASPSIFKMLPREQAGQVVGGIFPQYHLLGYVSCLVSLGCLVGLRQMGTVQGAGSAMMLLILMGGIQMSMGMVIGPQVVLARDAVKAEPPGPDRDRLEQKFRGMHAISMVLNLVLLALGLLLLFWISSRLQL